MTKGVEDAAASFGSAVRNAVYGAHMACQNLCRRPWDNSSLMFFLSSPGCLTFSVKPWFSSMRPNVIHP